MTKIDPNERLTSSEIIQHPMISTSKISRNLPPRVKIEKTKLNHE